MICLCDSKSQYVLAVGPSSNHNQREWTCDKATPYDFAMTAFAEDNRDYLYGVGPFIGLAIRSLSVKLSQRSFLCRCPDPDPGWCCYWKYFTQFSVWTALIKEELHDLEKRGVIICGSI
jgi:hypothetical protein